MKNLILFLVVASCAPSAFAADEAEPRVLVFSYSTGWRHDSIPAGIDALAAIGEREGYVIERSEDPDVFSAGRLDA